MYIGTLVGPSGGKLYDSEVARLTAGGSSVVGSRYPERDYRENGEKGFQSSSNTKHEGKLINRHERISVQLFGTQASGRVRRMRYDVH